MRRMAVGLLLVLGILPLKAVEIELGSSLGTAKFFSLDQKIPSPTFSPPFSWTLYGEVLFGIAPHNFGRVRLDYDDTDKSLQILGDWLYIHDFFSIGIGPLLLVPTFTPPSRPDAGVYLSLEAGHPRYIMLSGGTSWVSSPYPEDDKPALYLRNAEAALSLPFPNLILSLRYGYSTRVRNIKRLYSKKGGKHLLSDTTTDYEILLDLFKKTVPVTGLLAFGFESQQRQFHIESKTTKVPISFTYLRSRLQIATGQIRPFVKIKIPLFPIPTQEKGTPFLRTKKIFLYQISFGVRLISK